jgi:hypothetical protein
MGSGTAKTARGIGEIAGGDSRAIWSAVADEVITTVSQVAAAS